MIWAWRGVGALCFLAAVLLGLTLTGLEVPGLVGATWRETERLAQLALTTVPTLVAAGVLAYEGVRLMRRDVRRHSVA